jgi:hypothetical protein
MSGEAVVSRTIGVHHRKRDRAPGLGVQQPVPFGVSYVITRSRTAGFDSSGANMFGTKPN